MGLCIKELDRIYGIREGSLNQKGNNRIGQSNNFTDKNHPPSNWRGRENTRVRILQTAN